MTYAVITTEGSLRLEHQAATVEAIRKEVGDWDMVRLANHPLKGFVSDTGLIDGQTERNVVGALMVMTCGGPQQPYAGPIVITGWHQYHEIVSLEGEGLEFLQEMHRCITETLAGNRSCTQCTDEWRSNVLAAAEMVKSAPTPEIRVIHLGGAS